MQAPAGRRRARQLIVLWAVQTSAGHSCVSYQLGALEAVGLRKELIELCKWERL